MKTNVYDLTMKMAFAKEIIINLCVHHADDKETCWTVTKTNTKDDPYAVRDTFDYRDFEVIMFSAPRKNTFEIWGIKCEEED